MKKIYKLILLICLSLIFILTYFYVDKHYPKIFNKSPKEIIKNEFKLEEEPKKELNKLMIVAHSSDETIFGGKHLLDEKYYVVCITCGNNTKRLNEFISVMNITNDEYEYYYHLEEINYQISDWQEDYNTINEEIKNLLNSKEWDIIITHNPEGEYNNNQHKIISEIVTNNINDKNKLYYFGKFYESGTENSNTVLQEEEYSKKRSLLDIFESQAKLPETSRLSYMFRNENWIQYNNWYK